VTICGLKRVLTGGLVLLTLLAPALMAHAILLEASPAKNGSVTGPDFKIHLKYNSRIDASRSQISLLLPDKTVRTLTIEKQASPEMLTAQAAGMKAGTYHLRWQVLASDGHITRGEYPFEVK
jgi:copper resistance protein C